MILKKVSVSFYRNDFLKRIFNLSVSDDSINYPQNISNYSYDATIETLKDFEKLFSKKISLIEDWGDERFLVTSTIEKSSVKDIIFNEDLGVYPTEKLFNLLTEWKNFQEYCFDKVKLKILINEAYTEICKNPNQYKKWDNVDLYEIFVNDVSVNLILLDKDGDFDLTPEEYINQIKALN